MTSTRLAEGVYPALYFDCGTDDFLYQDNCDFHEHLQSIGYPHTYQEFSGGHTWDYWTTHLRDVLVFMARHFSRES